MICREESRFASNWKQPNTFGNMGDNLMQPNLSQMGLGMGPGGDSAFNGSAFRPHSDDNSFNEGRVIPDHSSNYYYFNITDVAISTSVYSERC